MSYDEIDVQKYNKASVPSNNMLYLFLWNRWNNKAGTSYSNRHIRYATIVAEDMQQPSHRLCNSCRTGYATVVAMVVH